LRCPENRSGLRCSSDFPTAAEIPQCLHLPPAAALRDTVRAKGSHLPLMKILRALSMLKK
jgi:hypothetical protein